MTSFRHARWELTEVNERDVLRLSRDLDVPAPVARILLARGYSDAAHAAEFLDPSLERHLHDPRAMLGMDRAVGRLERAIADGERIRIVSDYDVDGTTASVILQHTFRLLGAGDRVSYHIPSRFDEGYGFSVAAAEQAARDGAAVVVTCDIGVRDHAAVNRAADLGIDVIVCDHHLPPGEDVPSRALAVLCPKQNNCEYPNDFLAACGLSLKVAQAMLAGHPKRDAVIASLVKLAAIGTVADMVELDDLENRAIVSAGLKGLSGPSRNHGLAALLEVSGLGGKPVSASDCGYKLGPRINAAGRLAAATTVIELFNATSTESAMGIARELNRLNGERQEVQQRLVEHVMDEMGALGEVPPVALFAGDEAGGWHRGVVGIVASKVVDALNRPAFIVAVDSEGVGRGSARSANGIHLVDALESASDLLVKFGGHRAAAGFTVQRDHIESLRDRLTAFVTTNVESDGDLAPRYRADAAMSPDEVTLDAARELQRLEPHGIGNPRPMFLVESATVRRVMIMKDRHLKLVLAGDDAGSVEAVWWDGAEYASECPVGARIDVLASCSVNEWQGVSRPQLVIKDARPAR